MRSGFFVAAALIAGASFAQTLSLGVAGGGSLTDSFTSDTVGSHSPTGFSTRFFSPSKDYLIGPVVEFQFRSSPWSIEADGLFRQLHLSWALVRTDGSLTSISRFPVVTWEFPVLVRYRFQVSKVQPLVEIGPSFRTAGNLNYSGTPSHAGVTAGFGIEMRTGSIDITPELRYTRWAADAGPGPPKSASNQVELIVAVTGSRELGSHPLGRHLSVGAIFGTGLTDDVRAQSATFPEWGMSTVTYQGPRSLIAGPRVEFQLRRDLSIETNAIYRSLRSETVVTASGIRGSASAGSTSTWELPVLAKYRLGGRSVKPFIEVGPSFRLPPGGVLSNHGLTAGAGVEAPIGRLKVAPTVRYTHWASDNPPGTSGTIPNQVECLVAFSL